MPSPNQLPDYPIGTPEQVREVGLSPERVYTCSEPKKDGSNPGCPEWRKCKEGLDRTPCYLGCETLTPLPGGGWTMRREVLHCHVAYRHMSQSRYNGVSDPNDPDEMIPQIVQIVAREGEAFTPTGGSVVTIDAKGNRTSELKETPLEGGIPRYPHPRDLPMFRAAASASMIADKIKAQRAREDEDRIIGLGTKSEEDGDDDDPGDTGGGEENETHPVGTRGASRARAR